MKNRELTIGFEGDELVIRIGVETLVTAAEHCPALFDNDERRTPPYATVIDPLELVNDVITELTRGEDDGINPVMKAIDQAIFDAWEDGSGAFDQGE